MTTTMFDTNSFTINSESWFIPIDILMITCTVATVLLAIFFCIIIIFDKTCHTIPMMLVANSCLAQLIFGSDMLAMAIFTFHNDFKQIQYQDSLCIFRGYLGYVTTILQNHSYLLQAAYRYITVVYPSRLSWQSARYQSLFIFFMWIFGFICPLPYIITNQIQYHVDSQICQMPLGLSFLTIYNALCVYFIPMSLTILIYFKLVRYVRGMSKNVISTNTLLRAQRELKMVRQIVILVISVATIGFPYAIFIFMSLFTSPPKYHFRIAFIFVDVSLPFAMIALYKFTEALKTSTMKIIYKRTNKITPAIA
ncbi:unnamed protein product [Adineta steineri]|uniref:G-protein coupled receptors family 1 profile domain-containing protein n=1 Tax=Adineta steineri TaxID=433720 RepID=A0A814IJ27_9BILA|nr:unnamed protein product [Adineta steineri]